MDRSAKESVSQPWFGRLLACLSPRRPDFTPGSVLVGFMVENDTMIGFTL
jgi:hypothetical protein